MFATNTAQFRDRLNTIKEEENKSVEDSANNLVKSGNSAMVNQKVTPDAIEEEADREPE